MSRQSTMRLGIALMVAGSVNLTLHLSVFNPKTAVMCAYFLGAIAVVWLRSTYAK